MINLQKERVDYLVLKLLLGLILLGALGWMTNFQYAKARTIRSLGFISMIQNLVTNALI
jgi:hypothetical protein